MKYELIGQRKIELKALIKQCDKILIEYNKCGIRICNYSTRKKLKSMMTNKTSFFEQNVYCSSI